MRQWNNTPLSSVCDVFSGFPFKSALFTDDSSQFALVKGENVVQGRIDWALSKYWSRDDGEELDRHRLAPDDVVLAMDRPWIPAGLKYARITSRDPDSLLVQRVARLRAKTGLSQDYLYFVIGSPDFSAYVQNIGRGVGVPHISGREIGAYSFLLPPLPIQQAIADILSTYDGLIDNNRRRMALLEESARHLYEEWFVHLRFPGHEHTRIVDGVPDGWERKPLTDVAEFRLGKMLDEKKNKGDLLPYLANINVRWGGFDLQHLREMRFEEDELETFGLKYGDIVMCEGGEPGRCAMWKDELPRMMIQKAIHRIRSREKVDRQYLYYSLRHKGQSGQLATLFTGATIKHLPREKLALVKVDIPPTRLMGLFGEQVGPIERQIKILSVANQRAVNARDLLLPRLMNGEVAV
jgi:type I restriction enzyme S subunit